VESLLLMSFSEFFEDSLGSRKMGDIPDIGPRDVSEDEMFHAFVVCPPDVMGSRMCVDARLQEFPVEVFRESLSTSKESDLEAPFVPVVLLEIEFEVLRPVVVVDVMFTDGNVARSNRGRAR